MTTIEPKPKKKFKVVMLDDPKLNHIKGNIEEPPAKMIETGSVDTPINNIGSTFGSQLFVEYKTMLGIPYEIVIERFKDDCCVFFNSTVTGKNPLISTLLHCTSGTSQLSADKHNHTTNILLGNRNSKSALYLNVLTKSIADMYFSALSGKSLIFSSNISVLPLKSDNKLRHKAIIGWIATILQVVQSQVPN